MQRPRLGLFWFVGTSDDYRFVGLSKDAEDVPTIGGFKTLDEGHVDVWEDVVRKTPELSRYGYEFFPRGRVNWAADDDRYILLADRRILALRLHLEVVDVWHLPKDRLLVLSDPHYRCHSLTTALREEPR